MTENRELSKWTRSLFTNVAILPPKTGSERSALQAGDEVDTGDIRPAETVVVGDKELDTGRSGARQLNGIRRLYTSILPDSSVSLGGSQIERLQGNRGTQENGAVAVSQRLVPHP